ncbi:MAG: flotillin-like protein FloA [Planctomycetes bacterium]|nr:flotillin-like protein FloA [Planctomycetota bacterium]
MIIDSLPYQLAQALTSAPEADSTNLLFVGFTALVLFGLFWWLIGSSIMLYIQSVASNATVGLTSLVFMRIRKVNPTAIVTARITAKKAGIDITSDKLEAHYLAGGHVMRVVQAVINANKANIPLSFDTACAIDLAGRDVLDAVQTSVNPKVIDVPGANSGVATIDGVAQNGIQLKVKARVTVRTNLARLVGGATENTIVARVGQGIVSAIGAAKTHMEVLENPKSISRTVLDAGLDVGTAFEILSIDIADVIVGENIGARLQTDQAEAQKKIAQAEAEQRRAMAVAREQEMVALVAENRAKVVLAEAEIPLAMAEAFRAGKLGVMDYYNMRNVQADTEMRNAIASPEAVDSKSKVQ